MFCSTATHVTNLVATAPSVIAVQGTPSVVLSCVVSVSAEIGPDYSSLTVRWSLNGSPIVSVAPQPATSNQLQTSFMSSIEFTDIDTANAGQYCCVASMSGISGSRTACTSLTITGWSYCYYSYPILLHHLMQSSWSVVATRILLLEALLH